MHATLEVRAPCVEQYGVFATSPGFRQLKKKNKNRNNRSALNAYKILAKIIVCSYAFIDSLDCTQHSTVNFKRGFTC